MDITSTGVMCVSPYVILILAGPSVMVTQQVLRVEMTVWRRFHSALQTTFVQPYNVVIRQVKSAIQQV